MQHNMPLEVKNTFFEFLNYQKSVADLEQWLYQTTILEEVLAPDDYLELIAIDFGQRNEKYYLNCRYQINKIIKKYINLEEYETWKIKRLLNNFLKRKGDLAKKLNKFYDLYCHGYGFLDRLSLHYGIEFTDYYIEILSKEEIEQKIKSVLPGVDKEIKKVLSWLEQEKIKIINDPNSCYSIDYIDNRRESEKIPIYKINTSHRNK